MALKMPHARVAGALLLLMCLASGAAAQWSWRDQNGRPVYSDVPPPPNIKASDILRQPAQQTTPEPTEPANRVPEPAAAAAAPQAAAPPHAPTLAEQEQEFRKRMKERADSEKQRSDEQARLARNSESCQRARGYLRALDDGARLVRTDADGNRTALDEEQRAAEVERTRQTIEQTCK